LASITNPAHVTEIEGLFDLAFDDGTAAWLLNSDGTWTQRTTNAEGEPLLDMQEYLITVKSRRRAAK
jgi:polyphosphate kinase